MNPSSEAVSPLLQRMALTSPVWGSVHSDHNPASAQGSPLRGFTRSEDHYKALLKAADEHRHRELDERGNLTQAGLIEWMSYTLDTCKST